MYRLLSTVLNVSLVNESNHVYNISLAGIYTNDRVYYLIAPPPHAGEVDSLLTSAGLVREQLYTDRRLQVNRGRQVKMYRVWVQSKYRKMEEQPQRDKTQSHVET